MCVFQDNTPKTILATQSNEALRLVANQSVGFLLKENPDLLVFPQCLNDCEDDLKNINIIGLYESVNADNVRHFHIQPTNLVGYFGIRDTSVSIISRFSNTEKQNMDYFLHYLLFKTLSINLFNLEHSISEEDSVFDFLILLFPGLLKQALTQGVYKEYRSFEKNDSNVKGRIDISRHFRNNIPFNGKIAYQSREISYDNSITELIRHTIEVIKNTEFGRQILSADVETSDCIKEIVAATPAYSRSGRNSVIQANIKPSRHPYYTKYRPLQNLCLRILRHQKIRYGKNSQKIYGVLFDMSWLWEEYLAQLIPEYIHPQNRKGIGAIYLGKNGALERYPDFYQKKSGGIVLDAKYKNSIDRNDQHQVIAYMYRLQSKYGAFLMPRRVQEKAVQTELLGYGKQLGYHYLNVPQEEDTFVNFCLSISESEKSFQKEILALD